jgi:hypothetical protein
MAGLTVSDWVSVAAALVGAVVGGIMALVGAVFVARREQLRATRMRLLEAIDALRSRDREYPGQLTPEGLHDVRRAMVLLSRRERKVILAITSLAEAPFPPPPRRDGRPEERPHRDYRQTQERLLHLLGDLERLVLRRLARVL